LCCGVAADADGLLKLLLFSIPAADDAGADADGCPLDAGAVVDIGWRRGCALQKAAAARAVDARVVFFFLLYAQLS